jgi:sua5/yciO/yrdC/ywlC family protein
MPEDELAREFIRLCKTPIAAPSANLSGSPSPTSAEHVYKDMKGRIDMLIASDDSKVGLESTIVDVSVSIPLVLRPGAITLNMLREVNENISIDPAILKKPEKDLLPKAPGMKYRHYAPKAKLVIVEGDFDKFKSFVEKEKDLAAGKKIGLILTEENKGKIEADEVEYVGSRLSYEDIAHNLFAVLRRFDEKNIDIIYSESFDESELGMAIMNRLVKASGYNIVKL